MLCVRVIKQDAKPDCSDSHFAESVTGVDASYDLDVDAYVLCAHIAGFQRLTNGHANDDDHETLHMHIV